MTNDAHDMGLTALVIEGVAQGLAVDGETLILPGVDFVPASQGAVQMGGGDADQNIAEDVLAGHDVTAPLATAPEALPGLLPETLGPIGDRPVAAHAAEDGSGRNGQNGGQAMSPSLGTAGIGDLGKEGGEGLHLRGGKHQLGLSWTVRWSEPGLAQQPPGIAPQGLEEDHLGGLRGRAIPRRVRRKPRVLPTYTQLAARYTVPRKRCGSTKVS